MTGSGKVSRRALLSTIAASATLAGQEHAPDQPAAPEIDAARRQQQSDYEQMRKTTLPRTVEPATVFRP